MDHAAKIEALTAKNDALTAKNDALRGRVEQLEDLLGVSLPAPLELGLTSSEGGVLGVLCKRSVASKEAVMAALYRDLGKDEPEIKIVDVFVCKLRRKLRPYGIEIATHWGQGWSISAEGKARIAQMREAAS